MGPIGAGNPQYLVRGRMVVTIGRRDSAALPAGETLILVTHSKGTVDTLEALAKYPALANRVAAVISVSGAVYGSPLADSVPGALVYLGHQMPLATCPPGENVEAVESLRRSVRVAWLATHRLPAPERRQQRRHVRRLSVGGQRIEPHVGSEDRPLFGFAGPWTPWRGVRGPKSAPVEGNHELFGFLTTEANAIVAPIHPKAMPVILRSQEEADRWLEADTPDALALQRPLPNDALKIVAKGEKEDAARQS